MKYLCPVLVCLLLLYSFQLRAQHINKFINKDSLFKTFLSEVPKSERAKFQKAYDTASDEEREFFILMLNMPHDGSKKELIENVDTNYQNIALLKKEYLQLVPADFTIYIEFKPADKVLDQPETIDLRIYKGSQPGGLSIQKWNLQHGDPVLDLLLKMVGWNYATIDKIKILLHAANCVSIENEDVVTVGYARSGMGMYFYKLFDKNLTSARIKDYNDGCTYIYYRQNIVLEYEGGAIGSQCFPD